jgi:glutathione synthase/RimK-type ligase-like ATP-grasp enzyme
MTLLLAGGDQDPNLTVLADAAVKAGTEIVDLRTTAVAGPAFCWQLDAEWAKISDKRIEVSAAFIRHDVFSSMKDPRPEVSARAMGWYQAIAGWVLTDPGIRMFNREMTVAAANKPVVLSVARRVGLPIPETLITNDVGKLPEDQIEFMIAKPVLGGDYCYSLSDALKKTRPRDGLAATPAIVQQRLAPPEVRIYVVGQRSFAFEIRSDSLDYRVKQDAELILLREVPKEAVKLRELMSVLGLDFGAADFKTDPKSGLLLFLEVNTSPMFSRFDYVSGGQLCAAMIQELSGGKESTS